MGKKDWDKKGNLSEYWGFFILHYMIFMYKNQ